MEKIKHAAIIRSDGILELAKCHPEIIKRCPYGTCKDGSKMGFVTSTGRYVDRKEAMAIALEAGQINKDMDTLRQSGLISENIWADTEHEYDPEIGYYIKETPNDCPFCGGKADVYTDETDAQYDMKYCMCVDCLAKSDHERTEVLAIASWNLRTDPVKDQLIFVLEQIIKDLPRNKDWLDPTIEEMAEGLLKTNG